ncbi:diol dehydratase reactivase ATPase-like domain-containing protein [Mycobacterium sp. C31M]
MRSSDQLDPVQLPFTSVLSGAEWRSWRLAAKRLVIGGGAGDDELVRALAEELGHDVTVGRGDVAGVLGHRFAVAFGLVVLASAASDTSQP